MSELTTDPGHPGLGVPGPDGQNLAYRVLSEEERGQGYVRPVRTTYRHTTCGTETRMSLEIAQTYARDPHFYGKTFCVGCGTHLPVGEFTWVDDGTTVGS